MVNERLRFYASVDRQKTTAVEVNQALIGAFAADVEALYPGYQLDFRGVFR